jgi:superfamily II DNA or RNA helicase
MRELYPHQLQAIESLRQALLKGENNPMLQAPTGAGKTVIAGQIVRSALAKGKRVTITVPKKDLIDQTIKSFWGEGIREIGAIQARHEMTDPTRPVQIATVQSLSRRELPETDLVIVDEAHTNFDVINRWMAARPKLRFIGLSATPWSKGLGKHWYGPIVVATTQELIEKGYLCPFRVFAPSDPDLSSVRTKAGDYREDDLSKAMQPLTGDVVTTWLERGEDRPTFCFAVDRAHAKHLEERFDEAGVAAAFVDCRTPDDERERIRRGFSNGSIKVVCNVGVLTTGIDWDVRCLILARPTKSEILYTQIIGRCLRNAPGKDCALILDHSSTTKTLGFVTDIHHEGLHSGNAKDKPDPEERKKPLPRCCPKCDYLQPPMALSCENCGYKLDWRAVGVKSNPGELVELDDARRAKAARTATMGEKIEFMGELRRYARNKGWKEGWCYHAYRERFGVQPRSREISYAPVADYVSAATMRWITARNIRKSHERKSMGGRA